LFFLNPSYDFRHMASALQGTTTAFRKDPVINKNPKVLRKKNHPIISYYNNYLL